MVQIYLDIAHNNSYCNNYCKLRLLDTYAARSHKNQTVLHISLNKSRGRSLIITVGGGGLLISGKASIGNLCPPIRGGVESMKPFGFQLFHPFKIGKEFMTPVSEGV